ncbi:MAG: hypothetical protein O7B99_04990 [Planctomycetota bacterium]|nr:hypothetical protein [Planctomycetota bacterium]
MADSIDDLRRAWQGLEPPETGGALGAQDPETRASVDWMRAAWLGLEPPPTRVPVRSGHLRRKELLRPERVLLRVAAALLFIASGAALAWKLFDVPSGTSEPAPAVARNGAAAGEPIESTPAEEDQVVIASLAHDHIEMRSGPVRLILLTDSGVTDGAASIEATDD